MTPLTSTDVKPVVKPAKISRAKAVTTRKTAARKTSKPVTRKVRKAVAAKPAAPVTRNEDNPAWLAALKLAGGDESRLTAVSPNAVVVANPK
jgi:hypothetical protein